MEENSIKCINMNLCTACGACENICPAHAVVMQYDQNGFMYPIIIVVSVSRFARL